MSTFFPVSVRLRLPEGRSSWAILLLPCGIFRRWHGGRAYSWQPSPKRHLCFCTNRVCFDRHYTPRQSPPPDVVQRTGRPWGVCATCAIIIFYVGGSTPGIFSAVSWYGTYFRVFLITEPHQPLIAPRIHRARSQQAGTSTCRVDEAHALSTAGVTCSIVLTSGYGEFPPWPRFLLRCARV